MGGDGKEVKYVRTLTDTGRVIKRINPKNVTRERRRLKAYKRQMDAGRMTYEDIEQSVNEYRASLIIETYQNKLVEQKFKPQITNDDIQAYYDQMKQSFTLSDPAFKGCFAVIPANSPDQKEFFKTLSNFNEESSLKIEEYLFQHRKRGSLP